MISFYYLLLSLIWFFTDIMNAPDEELAEEDMRDKSAGPPVR